MNFKFLTLAFLALIAFSSCETENVYEDESSIVANAVYGPGNSSNNYEDYWYYNIQFSSSVSRNQYDAVRARVFDDIGHNIEVSPIGQYDDNVRTETWRVFKGCYQTSNGVLCVEPDVDNQVQEEIETDPEVEADEGDN